MVSLCGSDNPETLYRSRRPRTHRNTPASASWVLEPTVCATLSMPWYFLNMPSVIPSHHLNPTGLCLELAPSVRLATPRGLQHSRGMSWVISWTLCPYQSDFSCFLRQFYLLTYAFPVIYKQKKDILIDFVPFVSCCPQQLRSGHCLFWHHVSDSDYKRQRAEGEMLHPNWVCPFNIISWKTPSQKCFIHQTITVRT